MLDVYITIDTEFWPRSEFHESGDYLADYDRDIMGKTPSGSFGIEYQADVLSDHGLQAVFFVEPLCSYVVGDNVVQDIVELVQSRGHDVQLHMHTEWLDYMDDPVIPDKRGLHTRSFSLEDQTLLIQKAKAKIEACGASDIRAFRAGNFGANLDTLAALRMNGMQVDSSYNECFLGKACDMNLPTVLSQQTVVNGVLEFPVTCFRDLTGRPRPLQLTASSYLETKHALLQAYEYGWKSVVVVSHSFELIRGRGENDSLRPDKIAIRRFDNLCQFLNTNRDKFNTATFSDLPYSQVDELSDDSRLKCPAIPTLIRFAEQLIRRAM